MKEKSIFKELNTLGNVNVYYSLVKSIGLIPAFLLGRLLSEENYAKKHGFTNGYDGFLTNISILESTGLSVEDIYYGLNILSDLDFICADQEIDSFVFDISIHHTTIINYVKSVEKERNYQNWDSGLSSVQKEILKKENVIAKACALTRARKLISEYTDNKELQDLFVDYVESSQETIDSVVSDTWIRIAIEDLDVYNSSDEEKIQTINNSIACGYLRLYPPYHYYKKQ